MKIRIRDKHPGSATLMLSVKSIISFVGTGGRRTERRAWSLLLNVCASLQRRRRDPATPLMEPHLSRYRCYLVPYGRCRASPGLDAAASPGRDVTPLRGI